MKEDKYCVIPRNLNTSDTIKIAFGLRLKLIDLPFLAGGAGLAHYMTRSHENIALTGATYVLCIGSSYIFNLLKKEDQNVPQIAVNTVLYHGKKHRYKKLKKNGGK